MTAAGVALLAGCGSSGTSAAGGTSATTPAATATTPGTSATPAGTPSVVASLNTGASSGTPECATRDLKATIGSTQGAAGSVYLVLDFTNISGSPCTLDGYPGVSLAGGTPVTQLGHGADRSNANPKKLVTLAAGGVGSAVLQIAQADNYPASSCAPKPATYLQIFPPNQTTPIYLAYSTKACAKTVHQLTIQAVQPGSGG
jgi:hypothetical protein